MGVGGQTGVKKILKDAIQQKHFIFSNTNINNAIHNAAIEICLENLNSNQTITDNSIQYLIHEDAIRKLIMLAQANVLVTRKDIEVECNIYPDFNPKFTSIKNDVIAFIRNERQILYYYGFFHSKSSGASDFEFSSLTPIGEAALIANSYEFLCIWEHQKIKMISQPANADINQLPTDTKNPQNFTISFSPYLDILGFMIRNGGISLDEYMYIVSRKNRVMDELEWLKIEKNLVANLPLIKSKVSSFGRTRDVKTEDARKELLKYLLGVRSDLGHDNSLNPLNLFEYDRSKGKYVLHDEESAKRYYEMMIEINKYKNECNELLFLTCEKDLRKRYVAGVNQFETQIDPKVKINWDLYNIGVDKFIMLATVFIIGVIDLSLTEIKGLTKDDCTNISKYCFHKFKRLLKLIGITSETRLITAISQVSKATENSDFSKYIEVDEDKEKVVADYRECSASDLLRRIKDISSNCEHYDGERKRNRNLINLLKAYYIAVYSKEKMLTCECCGHDTFFTESGDTYVEFHHLVPFKIAMGPDHYLNLYALCPNCHRKIHLIKVSEKEVEYRKIDINNYLKSPIVNRLKELKDDKILRSYHLEYLLAERAITQEQYNSIAS